MSSQHQMKRLIFLSAIGTSAAIGTATSTAAINGDNAESYYERGVAMYNDMNFNGCIDQMLQIRNLDPSKAASEEVHYYIAMATLYSGDDEAIDLLQNFLDRFPQSWRTQDVIATIGDYYFTRNSYGEALEKYNKVNNETLTANRLEDLAYRRAYCHMMLGEYDRATYLFDQLMQTEKYGNAAKFYKAYIAYSKRDYAEARRLFKEVDLTREPGQSARYYLCQLDFMDGKYQQTFKEAKDLLECNPEEAFRPELKRIAGESLYNLGRTDEAMPYLQQYVAEAESPQPSAYYMLGVDDYSNGNYSKAISELQRATESNSAIGQSAYLYLGQSYVKNGDTNAAMLAFEKSSKMEFDPSVSEAASYNYIAARMDGGRVPFANSVGTLEDFLKKYPKSKYSNKVRESLIGGYMSDSDFDNALRILNSTDNPTASMLAAKQRVLLQLGTRAYQNGETDKALQYFQDGISINNGKSDVESQCRLWSANCLYDLGDFEKAADNYMAYLNYAPENDSNRLPAYYNLGYTRLRQGRYADAFNDFIRVADNRIADEQTRADAYNRAADCLYCQRRFNEAADYYNKAYKIYPQSGDYALFQQAQMSGLNRDYTGRISLLDDMLSRFPASALVPDALMAKAESYTVLGKNDRAMDLYAKVRQEYPATAQGRRAALMTAMLYNNSGNRNGAIEAYRQVATDYPSSQEARVALDDLRNIYASEGRLPEYVTFVNSIPGMSKMEISELESTAFATAEEQYLNNKDTDRMLDYLTQFTDGENVPAALLYMARESSDRSDFETSESFALRIINQYPDSEEAEEAMMIKAESEAESGKGEMALETYRELSKRASTPETLTNARLGILTTAVELNRYNDALEAADQLLSSTAANTDNSEVKFYRATALDRLGRNDEACSVWNELAEDPSTLYGSKSAVSLIESLTSAGKLQQAEKAANDFIDAGSPHNYWYARGFIAYSDVLRKQGKTFEADEYLKALKANYPGQEADIFEMIESRLIK